MTTKATESKIKIHNVQMQHLRFMGVHDVVHANLEGGASQQRPFDFVIACNVSIAIVVYLCFRFRDVQYRLARTILIG